jgi:hypothetical protein
MRIISNSRGDYVQVLEEFTARKPGDWLVVLHRGQVMILYQTSNEMWNKQEFIEYKTGVEVAQWRTQILKEERLLMFNDILASVIRFERELKINEVLRDENEYQYWVC